MSAETLQPVSIWGRAPYPPRHPVHCVHCDATRTLDEHWRCTECSKPSLIGYEKGRCPDCGETCWGHRYAHDWRPNCRACWERDNPEAAERERQLKRREAEREAETKAREIERHQAGEREQRLRNDASECFGFQDDTCQVRIGQGDPAESIYCQFCVRAKKKR